MKYWKHLCLSASLLKQTLQKIYMNRTFSHTKVARHLLLIYGDSIYGDSIELEDEDKREIFDFCGSWLTRRDQII